MFRVIEQKELLFRFFEKRVPTIHTPVVDQNLHVGRLSSLRRDTGPRLVKDTGKLSRMPVSSSVNGRNRIFFISFKGYQRYSRVPV